MKKKILYLLLIPFLITGCFNKGGDTNKFINKVNKSKQYYLTGNLEIVNNENTYKYKVKVSYKYKNQYKVDMINKVNDHQQIILRNKTSVYVITPSLHKSFKFQSDWPYNNSQSYLLQNLVNDIKNDKKKKIKTKDGYTIVEIKPNYLNNKNFDKEKIYLKSGMVKKVEVIDKDKTVKLKMTFDNIDFSPKFSKDYFKLNKNLGNAKTMQTSKEINEVTYPMYLPNNTHLSTEDKINDRVILNFLGDKSFTLIEQPVKVSKEFETINVDGDPELLLDTIGVFNEKEIKWISNGAEYYATSKDMSEKEMLRVVNSISSIPVSK